MAEFAPRPVASLPNNLAFGELPKVLQNILADGEIPVSVGVNKLITKSLLDLIDDHVLIDTGFRASVELGHHPFSDF
jgi:hypothetical protein